MTFALMGKKLEHMKDGEILCVQHLKILSVSGAQGYKNLKERIQSLHSNVVDCPFVGTSQS